MEGNLCCDMAFHIAFSLAAELSASLPESPTLEVNQAPAHRYTDPLSGAWTIGVHNLHADNPRHTTSDIKTYRIRKTEYALNTRSGSAIYDGAHVEACAEVGANFPKFPRSFSIADTLLSPSGHALRMAIEFFNGNVSISMFTEKIICNFRNVARKFVKSSFGRSRVNPFRFPITASWKNHFAC